MTATSGADRKPCGCTGASREHHHGCTKFAGAGRPTLREQIGETLYMHGVSAFSGDSTACRCDHRWRTNTEHRAHLADALLPVVERAKAEAAAEPWKLLADLFEAVARGDEVGMPEAYRAADAALRSQGGGR